MKTIFYEIKREKNVTLVYTNVKNMHSIRVEGVIKRVTSITHDEIIFDYKLATESNVVFSSKLISISFNLSTNDIPIEKAIDFFERIEGEKIELYLCFPLWDKKYDLDLKHSSLFHFTNS